MIPEFKIRELGETIQDGILGFSEDGRFYPYSQRMLTQRILIMENVIIKTKKDLDLAKKLLTNELLSH